MVSGQDNGQNYIKTLTYREATTASDANKAKTSVTYYDGLGRPVQQVAGKMSNSGNDIITHIEYDGFGRQAKEFLPYASANANLGYDASAGTNVLGYYLDATKVQQTTDYPYTQKVFEASPLERVLKQAAPGDAWGANIDAAGNHAVKFSYQANGENEVKKLIVTAAPESSTGIYSSLTFSNAGYYPAGQLYKHITKDEDWTSGTAHTAEVFTDKEGHTLLKRSYNGTTQVNTYYVYDQFGNLTYVLPPLCNGEMTNVDNLGYQYKYDSRNRIAEKKLPGKQWEFIVYDALDRPVLTGPAITPFGGSTAVTAEKGWLMTIYDTFGRPSITGWLQATVSTTTRKSRQDAYGGASMLTVTRGSGNSTIDGIATGYMFSATPPVLKLLGMTYYDDYTWPGAPSVTASTQIEGQPVLAAPKGSLTGAWTRVLSSSTSAADNEVSYTLYDAKGRPVRAYTKNYLGGYKQVDSKLDFDGTAAYSVTRHKRSSATTDTELVYTENFTYDERDRLIQHSHTIGASTAQTLAQNSYDELGQLIAKKVGSYIPGLSGSSVPMQTVDYRYNVRGWLTDINNVNALGSDLFAFRIAYDTPTDHTGGSLSIPALYNGNISETYWRSSSDNVLRKYSYKYDGLNRLTDSYYQKPGASTVLTGSYNESMTYDLHGNIRSLQRNGAVDDATTKVAIDDLTYTYAANSNRLLKVYDHTLSPQGFKDINNSTNIDYTYDDNGNMTADLNKAISNIKYNHLNLPTEISFTGGNKILYLYNSSGQKVKKTVTEDAATVEVFYLDGFQYKGTVLQFFPTAEGYVDNTVNSLGNNVYNYVYQYKDHLGNVRLSYGVSGRGAAKFVQAIEENNYYPFGLRHLNYNMTYQQYQELDSEVDLYPPLSATGKLVNNYRFLGQERQDELGLNWDTFRYRNYDYAIGRFFGVDPITEKFTDLTPYQFAHNNPVWKVELEGLEGASSQLTFWMSVDSALHPNGVSAHVTGIVQGGANAVVGLYNIVSNPGQTLKGLGNLALASLAYGGTSGMTGMGTATAMQIDNALGSNATGTAQGLAQSVESGIDKVVNGNGFERGEVIGEIIGSITIGEGIGAVTGPLTRAAGVLSEGSFAGEVAGEMVATAPKIGLTNAELVQGAATKAEAAIGGTGRFAGKAKHVYAKDLLSRYQSIYGDRGLSFEHYFKNGSERGFLDVLDNNNNMIYDYKFGDATMSNKQYSKYSNAYPGYTIEVVRP
ncbi:DUF6443 domain-containing protein [Sphingobacterium siyangense subsp. cladoniae]